MKTLVISVIFLGLLSSCYYDSEEALFPQLNTKTIDTTKAISYSEVIEPMIKANCRSCHNGVGGGGIRLADFNDVSNQATMVYNSILPSGTMPKGAPKLNNIYVVAFKKWMDQGKPNN